MLTLDDNISSYCNPDGIGHEVCAVRLPCDDCEIKLLAVLQRFSRPFIGRVVPFDLVSKRQTKGIITGCHQPWHAVVPF